ncbi:hypothetical protein F4Y93_03750 [Candidatus Poribacteria bacterium]|nr:hypothetical protein [Candidatus Poribacteria bacterium]
MVLNVLIDAYESDTDPIQPDEIRKRSHYPMRPSETEILEALNDLQKEDWGWSAPKGKGWKLTVQGNEWVKLQK